jgi:hypothetical protein
VWKNDGTGNFAEPLRFSSGAAPVNLIAQDVTGDGLIDVVVRSAFGGLTVMAGAGDGSFAAPVTVVAADSPFAVTSYGLSSSDFNNDGRPDIAFVSGSEIVILHNVAPPALRIEAVGEVMRIRWAKDFAREAILESAPTLDGEWTEHPFPPLGLDEEAMIFDSGAASSRFFRVRRR